MSKTRQPDKLPRAVRRLSWCAGLAVVLVVMAVGCGSTAHTHSGDPLFGEYYPKGPNGQPMPAPTPTKTSAVGMPPYPTANSATSTASIANNTNLPGGRPLAINENGGVSGTLTNTGANAGAPVGLGKPGVIPVPRDTSAPVASTPVPVASTPVPVASTSPAAPRVLPIPSTDAGATNHIVTAGSWTKSASDNTPTSADAVELQKSLETKGAFGVKQEGVPDGVRVSCYLPNNSGGFRYLETTAHDFVTGLEALVHQLDR